MRRSLTAVLAAVALVAAGLIAGASPAAAVTEAAPGAPCDSEDLGRRVGWIDTISVTPEITHFKAFFVTAGSTGTQTVQLTYAQQLTVTVLSETHINTGLNFGFSFLTKLEVNAHFSIQKVTQSTTTEQRTMVWNFTQPGYYAVYTGMHKVAGGMTALQCHRVQRADGTWATQWQRRSTGTYTSWGRDQEGAVRCEDTVPANTVMRLAQTWLGCDGTAAQRTAKAVAPTKPEPTKPEQGKGEPEKGAAAVPSGYTCEGYYRVYSTNGLVMDADDGHDGEYVGWTTGGGDSPKWRLCNGPADATGMQPSVLINRSYDNKCLGVSPDATETEGARIAWRSCESVPARQKLFIYRDVPGSDRIGLQFAYRGAMLGQEELVDGAVIRQYLGGMPDGSGTLRLVPA